MKKDIQMILSLFIISMVAAGSLALVYSGTIDKINSDAKKQMIENFKTVFPAADSFAVEIEDTLYIAYNNGQKIGVVFVVYPRGYADVIKTLVGMDKDGKITGIKTATPAEGLKETPGLGVKVNDDWFQDQFKGLTSDEVILKKDSKNGKIDAITAATISSRAVTNGIRAGMERFQEYLPKEEKADTTRSEQ